MRKGTVYLVGAGPGDAGLLTLRGAALLKGADTVIYDRLVSEEVLDLVPARTRRICAGKARETRASQDKINSIMESEAKRGRSVVRLKGGDPMLFGRGGEEAGFLRRRRIEFEVVPGVSSFLAGPAYAGIPVTHRDYSSKVLIVTGRLASSKRGGAHDWLGLAESVDTIVVMMGAATAFEIAKQLLVRGIDPGAPVAVVERATTSKQRVRLFSLESLSRAEGKETIDAPCVIVIGRVAGLAESLDWFRVRGRTTLEPRKGR